MEFTQTFEIIVIGGGPAGYHFANLCGKKGVSIALFEERALGGTCLNEGCIPTKSFFLFLFQVYQDIEFIKLCLLKRCGSINHHVAARVVLGECDTVADAVETCKETHEAVETICQATVRGSTILERAEQVAKL